MGVLFPETITTSRMVGVYRLAAVGQLHTEVELGGEGVALGHSARRWSWEVMAGGGQLHAEVE